MPLLDLPPEVFENVVHELVSIAGINGAWKARGACRTFKTAITYEVFAKQTVETFRRTAQRIFDNNLGLYLYYRSKEPLDAHPYLPDMINYMVNYLAKELDIDSDYVKDTMRQGLCDSLQPFCSPDWTLPVLKGGLGGMPTNSGTSDPPSFGSLEKLVAAICLRYHRLVPALMQEIPDLPPHPFFGEPLQLATRLGHEDVIKAILASISEVLNNGKESWFLRSAILLDKEESFPGRASPDKGFVIANAINAAIDQNDEDLLNILVKWYKGHRFAFYKNTYNHFLETAIRKSSLAIVKVVLQLSYHNYVGAKKVNLTHFQMACSRGREDVVQLFLDEGHIDANGKTKTSLLVKAALSDFPAIIKILIDAGANINQASRWNFKNVLPIMVAIEKRNLNTIRYLLKRGSHLPPISTWPTEKRFGRCFEILRQAKMKEGGGHDLPVFAEFRRMSPEEKEKL